MADPEPHRGWEHAVTAPEPRTDDRGARRATAWVDPQLRPSLAAYRTAVGDGGVSGITDVGERRALHARLSRQAAGDRSIPGNVTATDHEVAGVDGGPAVRVRAYTPGNELGAPLSAWLYVHGGGLSVGDLDSSHLAAANLAADAGTVVLSVDYRLAPETVFPGALDDCAAALRWLHDQADLLGVDRRRIGVYGVSAGGALAAALAQRSRDGQAAPIAKQVLVYPMLDDRAAASTTPEAPEGTWSWASNANAWDIYLGPEVDRGAPPPHAIPARAASLRGLPRTYLEVGSADVLAVEVITYAARLVGDGVPTELHVHPGAFHAFDVIAVASEVAATARAQRIRAVVEL
ncbi:alpha/beta hydrolase [Nocardioides immobilis]|uniref:Alpha/beta hydrolase n=1 Tax=Nocardioides immobilis TaxID=2049295 RepID=A0A417Y0Z7_9ACTN|nr:alpha/beta hydrolase [Nocardioides immobilis]RHW26266.1 alpha/beta hydrolase [Nocardioides immobilis]